MLDTSYGLVKDLGMVGFEDAVDRTTAALAREGFGVLQTIDVNEELGSGLSTGFRRYVILGACNSPLAQEALRIEPLLGLLLPCNVVVAQDALGRTVVAALDPGRMLSLVDSTELFGVVAQVGAKLRQALEGISG